MSSKNRTDELLDEIAAYADRLADSDKLADTGSMATAEALAELYEKREWVDEWLEQKPIAERKAYVGGRPPEPDSRNRFSQWLVWKEVADWKKEALGTKGVKGKGTDPRCGAIWFGTRIEHCTMCHQTFSGASTGDAHRVGPHDGERRCLTADELTALGLWIETNQYETDVWHGSPNKAGVQKRHPKATGGDHV